MLRKISVLLPFWGAVVSAIALPSQPQNVMGRSIFPRQDTPIPEECNLDKLPDIFVHDAPKVGNDCVTVFCFAKFKDGILLNQVEAWASVNDGLQWINVSWTDGSSEEASSMPSGQSEDYHGIVDWDLWRDWFKEFLLWGDLWGLSRMIITMDHSKCGGKDDCRSDAGGKNIGDEHVFSRGTKGDGMLLGLCGRHGTLAIDQLQPLFTSSRPTVLKIKDAKTTPTVDDLNSKSNLGDQGLEAVAYDFELFNNGSTEAKIRADIAITTKRQHKVTLTHEKGSENSAGFSLKVGFDVPVAELVLKPEIEGHYAHKEIVAEIDSEEDGKETSVERRFSVERTVKAGGKARCNATALQSKLSLKLDATEMKSELGNDVLQWPVQGDVRYAESSNVIAFCEDVAVDQAPDPVGAVDSPNVFQITESGTFCQDGRKVGDAGISDVDFLRLVELASR